MGFEVGIVMNWWAQLRGYCSIGSKIEREEEEPRGCPLITEVVQLGLCLG